MTINLNKMTINLKCRIVKLSIQIMGFLIGSAIASLIIYFVIEILKQ